MKVKILKVDDLFFAEIAARTCYSSLDGLESSRGSTECPSLVDSLVNVHHHASIAEHCSVSYDIQTTRGVLQELARHRIASFSVQSTRYTLSPIILSVRAAIKYPELKQRVQLMIEGHLETSCSSQSVISANFIFDSIAATQEHVPENIYMSKEAQAIVSSTDVSSTQTGEEYMSKLLACKTKRNAGDSFKECIPDTLKVNLVLTMNARSLKNFMKLRRSGAAYFKIRELAEEMYDILPQAWKSIV